MQVWRPSRDKYSTLGMAVSQSPEKDVSELVLSGRADHDAILSYSVEARCALKGEAESPVLILLIRAPLSKPSNRQRRVFWH